MPNQSQRGALVLVWCLLALSDRLIHLKDSWIDGIDVHDWWWRNGNGCIALLTMLGSWQEVLPLWSDEAKILWSDEAKMDTILTHLRTIRGGHYVLMACLVLRDNHREFTFSPTPHSQWFAFTQCGKWSGPTRPITWDVALTCGSRRLLKVANLVLRFLLRVILLGIRPCRW